MAPLIPVKPTKKKPAAATSTCPMCKMQGTVESFDEDAETLQRLVCDMVCDDCVRPKRVTVATLTTPVRSQMLAEMPLPPLRRWSPR